MSVCVEFCHLCECWFVQSGSHLQSVKHKNTLLQQNSPYSHVPDDNEVSIHIEKCQTCDYWFLNRKDHINSQYHTGATSHKFENNQPPVSSTCLEIFRCFHCHQWFIAGDDHFNSLKHKNNVKYSGGGVSRGYSTTQKKTKPVVKLTHCSICDEWYEQGSNHNQSTSHIQKSFSSNEPAVLVETAFKNRLQTYFIRNMTATLLDLSSYLDTTKKLVKQKIREILKKFESIKVNILIHLLFVKPESTSQKQAVCFKTKNVVIYRQTDLNDIFQSLRNNILLENENFHLKGSGWILDKIVGMELRINRLYNLSKGSSYIPLPFSSNCIINVKNNDSRCFQYSVMGKYLHESKKHKNSPYSYSNLPQVYDFSMLTFPVSLKDIPSFEKENNISISVFSFRPIEKEDKRKNKSSCSVQNFIFFPLKVVEKELKDHRDLLYFSNVDGTSHFCWITNLASLIRSQLTNNKRRIFLCKKCFKFYHDPSKLGEHKRLCSSISKNAFSHSFPDPPILKFSQHAKALYHHYCVFADFESYLQSVENDPDTPTFAYQQHLPMSYAWLCVSPDPKFNSNEPFLYRGDLAHIQFVNNMIELAKEISQNYNDTESPIILSPADYVRHATATSCQVCGADFQQTIKVRDHNHQYTPPGQSNYRMALCSSCNLIYRHPKSMLVFFHNLSRYDLHFIVKALNDCPHGISIVPSTEEIYLSLSIHLKDPELKEFTIKFIDTYRFLSSSLDNLVTTIPESSFIRTKLFCKTKSQFALCRQKAVFCYDYMTDASKLRQTYPPSPKHFYNKLNDKHITQEEYSRFCRTWDVFRCKTLGDYADVYLKLDVLLLSDVFQEFRSFCFNTYQLDCANYITLPSFAFDAFLKMTKVEIDLFTDYDMTLMINSAIRGGISQCSLRYAAANNPNIPDTYDETEPSSFIQYLDVTALYSYTMCKSLPYGQYRWVDTNDLENLNVCEIADDADIGYILEVDLLYPKHLEYSHSDLPFCAESKIPPLPDSKHPKLLTTLEDKKKYVIHFAVLKQAIRQGLILKKIHRAIRFKQRPFLKPFIQLNAKLRKEASNDFHRDLLKLISNACYGKFLENPLKRKDVRLVTKSRSIFNYIARVDFEDRTIFDEDLVAVKLKQTHVNLDRPVIVGFAVLELSKQHMYQFHYDVMLPMYSPETLRLLYMDTDSFIYLIFTENLSRDMLNNLDWYDTSNFPKNHICFSTKNEKELGTFKDETKGTPIVEFCGLKSKMYAYKTIEQTSMRVKGIQKCVKNKTLKFDHYLKVLFHQEDLFRETRRIGSIKHDIFSFQATKKALSFFDDKRFILNNSISTLPFGHSEVTKLLSLKRSAKSGNDDEYTLKKKRNNL